MARDTRSGLIDTADLTRTAGRLGGHDPVARFERLASMLDAELPGDAVDWELEGSVEPQPDGSRQPWLALRFSAEVGLTCTRCLQRVPERVAGDRRFLLVADETLAARADADTDDYDVLVGSRHFDVMELVEDELIMALPLVPRHAACALPVVAPDDAADGEPPAAADLEKPNPFAVLGRLRKPG